MGYLVAIFLQYTMIWYLFYVVASMLSLGIGAFMYSVLATDEIKRYLNENVISEKNQLESFKQLTEYVDYHSDVKQLSKN